MDGTAIGRAGPNIVFWKRRNHRPMTLRPEVLIAGAALLLSVTTVLAGAWFAIRGSVVTAVPPDSIFFYRDAGEAGAGAVLTAGVDTALVNSASGNYGDVITRIVMEIDLPGGDDPAFKYTALLTPVFSETAERQAGECPVTARCVVNDGQFLVIEEPRRTLDVPGGASRSDYVGFVLQKESCDRPGACDRFLDFQSVVALLERAQTITFRIRYQLHDDGEKVAVCRIDMNTAGREAYEPWLAAHLTNKGWVQLPCNLRTSTL